MLNDTMKAVYIKQNYYCGFPGNVNKGPLHCHLLSMLKVKTHCDLHSYWKDLQYWTTWAPCWQPPTEDNAQLRLKSWHVHNKFLHSWSCLVDFLSTPSQGRPGSSSGAQNVARRNELPPHRPLPLFPLLTQIILPRFQRTPREAFLLFYLQDYSQHKSRKWLPGADHPPLPHSLENLVIVSFFNLEMGGRGNRRVTLRFKSPHKITLPFSF